MPSWTIMDDLSPGDLVTAADMDAIRGNIEYLLNPNSVSLSEAGPYNVTTTTYTDMDATNLKGNITTNGGALLCMGEQGFSYGNESQSDSYLTVAVNGTLVDSTVFAKARNHYATTYESQTVVMLDSQSAGTYAYSIQAKVASGQSTFCQIGLYVVEI